MVEARTSRVRAGRGRWRLLGRAVFASLAIVVLSAELGLRFLFPERVSELRPQLEEDLANARLMGHPYMSYVGKPNYSSGPGAERQRSHDEWGLRGNKHALAKPEGVYRIVCLGGSSTYGVSPSSDETTWPARLEYWLNDQSDELTFQVINAGQAAYSTFESMINFTLRMLEWEPDLVLVYHTINDTRCALYARGGPARADNTHRRAIWPRVLKPPSERMLESSMTYLVLRKVLTSYNEGVDALNTHVTVNFDGSDRDPFLTEDIPDTGFDSFERNLRAIQAIAREFGAKVVFASQACDQRDVKGKSRDAQLAGMARMTAILERLAKEKGVVYVDAKRELEALAREEEGWDALFAHEVHLTDRGANRLALIFAREILLGGHDLLPE